MSSSLSLQLPLRQKEGKEEGNSSIFKSSLLCLCLKVISRLQLCPQFVFQLNYENDVTYGFWNYFYKNNHYRKFENCSKLRFKKKLLIINFFITLFYNYFFIKLCYFHLYIFIFFSTINQTCIMIILNYF